MANIIPPVIPDDAPDSERLVFELLRADPATEGWIIGHKVRPRQSRRRRRREVDFLILIPGVAALCLEVKGGEFEVRGGVWHRPVAARLEPIEPPVDQAEAAMYLMRDELVSQYRREWGNAQLPIGCAVVFTDTNWPDHIREPERPVIGLPELLRQGSRTLAERLLEIARRTRAEIPDASRLQLDTAVVQTIAAYLFPDTTLTVVPRPIPYHTAERLLINLTQEQHSSLDAADQNDRCLFTGAAGTGKTMLALELGKRRSAAGDRVALVCYNRILGDWLFNQSIEHFKLGDLVGSFWHHFAYTVIQQDGSRWPAFAAAMDNAADHNERFDQICPDYLRDVLLQTGAMFDYLIVDELQDMCQDPYLEIMDLALRGGLAGGRWAIFADFNQQFTNWGRNPDSAIDNLHRYIAPGEYAERPLLVNCRNTLPIIQDAASISGIASPETYLNPVRGPLPSYEYWRDDAGLRLLLDRAVRGFVNAGEPVSEIFVLANHPLRESGLDLLGHSYAGYALFDCPGIYWPPRAVCDQEPCCQIADDPDPHLKFREVRRFKGMESKVVILIIDRMSLPDDRAALYVGMTRARINLVVLAHESTRDGLARLLGR